MARISAWRAAKAGEVLMKEGESGTYFCILAEGQIKVTKKGKLLNVLHAGECFGEMAYLQKEGQRRVADVTVMTEAKIISIPTERLDQASDGCRHHFDRAFMEILAERRPTMANIRLSASSGGPALCFSSSDIFSLLARRGIRHQRPSTCFLAACCRLRSHRRRGPGGLHRSRRSPRPTNRTHSPIGWRDHASQPGGKQARARDKVVDTESLEMNI